MSTGVAMILLEMDPNLVKPGWTPLIITIVLGVVLALLFLSMRRQFNNINLPDSPGAENDPAAAPPKSQD